MNKKHLEDAKNCESICMHDGKKIHGEVCRMHELGFHKSDCIKSVARTALVYRAALKKLITIAEELLDYAQIVGGELEISQAKELLEDGEHNAKIK